jgi:hypothetical protein
MRATIRLYLVVSLLAFWLGGLTFYAGVVVPIANRVVGSDQQGLVTQQATNYLNGIGVGVLAVLLGHALIVRSRALLVVVALMSAAQVALFLIHGQLDAMLDSSAVDAGDFYAIHRRYLIVTAGHWLAGLAALWIVLAPRGRPHETSQATKEAACDPSY